MTNINTRGRLQPLSSKIHKLKGENKKWDNINNNIIYYVYFMCDT